MVDSVSVVSVVAGASDVDEGSEVTVASEVVCVAVAESGVDVASSVLDVVSEAIGSAVVSVVTA